MKTRKPVVVVEAEGEADPEPVDEAVDREAERAENPDAVVGAGLVGVVAVVEDQRPLGEEEGEEADRDEGGRPARVADVFDPLGEDVEERDGDDDAAGQRDHGRQGVGEAQRDLAADQGRDDGQAGEGDREAGHAGLSARRRSPQRGQVPRRTTSCAATANSDRRLTASIASSSASLANGASRPHSSQTM